jgi:hypothetical protein
MLSRTWVVEHQVCDSSHVLLLRPRRGSFLVGGGFYDVLSLNRSNLSERLLVHLSLGRSNAFRHLRVALGVLCSRMREQGISLLREGLWMVDRVLDVLCLLLSRRVDAHFHRSVTLRTSEEGGGVQRFENPPGELKLRRPDDRKLPVDLLDAVLPQTGWLVLQRGELPLCLIPSQVLGFLRRALVLLEARPSDRPGGCGVESRDSCSALSCDPYLCLRLPPPLGERPTRPCLKAWRDSSLLAVVVDGNIVAVGVHRLQLSPVEEPSSGLVLSHRTFGILASFVALG